MDRHRAGSIRTERVEKRYGPVTALAGVDLDVGPGEFLTLLGPSGSGKTTLLNLIAGFQRPDAGDILLDGRSISQLPAHARGFGVVFQSYALFPHMNVAENVAYPLRVRGVPAAQRGERVQRQLDLVELGHLAGRYPGQLSGGQQQRVALARALVFEPPVLLMDEPLGALDRRLRQSLQFEIKRLHLDLAATIIYVTHDQEEALAMSDRIAVMRDGRIEQCDVPRVVYERPRSAFVASFLGETNLLETEVVSTGRPSVLRHVPSGQRFSVPVDIEGDRPLISVRPENLAAIRPEGAALHGPVTSLAFMGDVWRFEVRVGDQTLIARQSVHEPPPGPIGYETGLVVRPDGAQVIAVPPIGHPPGVQGVEWKEA